VAYTQGDKILTDHYNTFVSGDPLFGVKNNNVNNINSLWGSGSGDRGYGQSTIIGEVSASNIVTAPQWATLLTRANAMASHQGSALGAATSPTGGDLITAITAIQANLDLLATNRQDAIATGTSDTITASDGTGWALTSTHRIDVLFSTADHARYFFNAGGHIDVTFSRVGGAGSSKELDWDDQIGGGLLGDFGTTSIYSHATRKVGGTGPYGGGTENVEHGIGYYELDAPGIEIHRQFASGSVYTSNKVNIIASVNGPQGVNNDNGSLVSIVGETLDPAATGDPITGTMNMQVLVRYPSTTFLTEAAWGSIAFQNVGVTQV